MQYLKKITWVCSLWTRYLKERNCEDGGRGFEDVRHIYLCLTVWLCASDWRYEYVAMKEVKEEVIK